MRSSEAEMNSRFLAILPLVVLGACVCAWAQPARSCASLMNFKASAVEITASRAIAEGTTMPGRGGRGQSISLPAHCRVEGIMNRRIGVGGEEFGIRFALALPDQWNGDFLMQGGGGSNGVVL